MEDSETARAYLQDALQCDASYSVPTMVILCLPIAAFLHKHTGRVEQAVELLALAYMHPHGPKKLLDKWPWMLGLRAELVDVLGTKEYDTAWERGLRFDLTETLSKLRDHFPIKTHLHPPPGRPAPILPRAVDPLVEPLSERELDILQMLKTELSGPEIARELMISLNTVRFHTKNIYTKLGVNNRRSAITKASELGL